MEIEIEPISLNTRLEYLQSISEIQQVNKAPFPWGIALVSLGFGVLGGLVFSIYREKNLKYRYNF